MLTIEERVFLIEHVFRDGDKFSENVKRKFRERFPNSVCPHRDTVRDLINSVYRNEDGIFNIFCDSVKLTIEKEDAPRLTGGILSEPFVLANTHFHWGQDDDYGSEHTVNQHKFSMEMHCVYFNERFGSLTNILNAERDEVLVMAFFLQVAEKDCSCHSGGNPMFDPLVKVLDSIREHGATTQMSYKDVVDIIRDRMEQSDYYTYLGSLTTPAYNEVVKWVVYTNPACISHRQVEAFRQLKCEDGSRIRNNIREIQPINGREILHCNKVPKTVMGENAILK